MHNGRQFNIAQNKKRNWTKEVIKLKLQSLTRLRKASRLDPSRFLNLDYISAHALTLKDIRRKFIDPIELDRISKLEMLDEIEELNLVLEHYAITWGMSTAHLGNRKAVESKKRATRGRRVTRILNVKPAVV
ncbi:hypothetical protein EV359DRAFT_83069 [Lentinula novae-zelandiae]|nr:hypothetical protein EV359DRAFT_83069 [Lentinula novae-zelandiae]